jgi:hypothetical protein
VVAYSRRWPLSKSVEYTDGERFVGHGIDFIGRGPATVRKNDPDWSRVRS